MLLRLAPGLPPPASLVSRCKELQRQLNIRVPKTKQASDSGSSRLAVAVLLAADEFNQVPSNANQLLPADLPAIAKAGCTKPRDVKEMLGRARHAGLDKQKPPKPRPGAHSGNQPGGKPGAAPPGAGGPPALARQVDAAVASVAAKLSAGDPATLKRASRLFQA
jgi:hypothetical protein